MHLHAAVRASWVMLAAFALGTAARAQPAPAPDAASLRAYHELLASEPHMAGTPGDAMTIERLRDAFVGMGIEDVRVHAIFPLLAHPERASLTVLAGAGLPETAIDLREPVLVQDPGTADPNVVMPFCAYSGSGQVEGEVVYANYGTKADFEKLASLGVSVKGKIVLARYGGNFRGYKAKFAQAAGAAGIVIFLDPGDVGYHKGLPYPEGTYASDTCVQRGSILTLEYPGDPLTPTREARDNARRFDPDEVGLPTILVQPVGYAAARTIMERMRGPAVPEGWQGGLPFTYRLEGGPDVKVRMEVRQRRQVMETGNVIAIIPGADPDNVVYVGCHHDSWVFGASDPLCGTIALLESARWLAAEAKAGRPPRRTVVFAAWGAEEFGLIGSTEWFEANATDVKLRGVAYINLDMASMGLDFNVAATPSLRPAILEATRRAQMPSAAGQPTMSVFDAWKARTAGATADWAGAFGDLGGGSDHVGFLCAAAVPSAGLGGGGAKGYSYHSAYDTLPWYWRTVGTDYASALMVTRVTIETVRSLAHDPLLPLDPAQYAANLAGKADEFEKLVADAGLLTGDGAADVRAALDSFKATAKQESERSAAAMNALRARAAAASPDQLAELNAMLRHADRVWYDTDGLADRPWYKNRFAAPDGDSGYAAWVLPQLRHMISLKDGAGVTAALRDTATRLERLTGVIERLDQPETR